MHHLYNTDNLDSRIYLPFVSYSWVLPHQVDSQFCVPHCTGVGDIKICMCAHHMSGLLFTGRKEILSKSTRHPWISLLLSVLLGAWSLKSCPGLRQRRTWSGLLLLQAMWPTASCGTSLSFTCFIRKWGNVIDHGAIWGLSKGCEPSIYVPDDWPMEIVRTSLFSAYEKISVRCNSALPALHNQNSVYQTRFLSGFLKIYFIYVFIYCYCCSSTVTDLVQAIWKQLAL